MLLGWGWLEQPRWQRRPALALCPGEWLRVALGEADGVLGGSHAQEELPAELAGLGATAGARGQQ